MFGNSGDIFKRYNIPQSHLFCYFQVRHFARSYNSNFPYSPPDSAYEKILNTQPKAKGFISQIYQIINSLTDTNIGKIKADWEKELGMDIPDSFWKQALIRVNKSSSCARLNLIQFKVLHRLHYSNSKLSKMYSTVADSCNRCHNSPADLTHMFWSCPHLTTYWNKVLKVLADSLSLNLTPNAWMCIFGVQGDGDKTLINKHKNIIAFSTLLARRRILMDWKSHHPPNCSMWLRDLVFFLKLEKIKFSLRGHPDTFISTWGPIIKYFDELKTLSLDSWTCSVPLRPTSLI